MELLNYQDYISQFVEIEGIPIKNVELGLNIIQTHANCNIPYKAIQYRIDRLHNNMDNYQLITTYIGIPSIKLIIKKKCNVIAYEINSIMVENTLTFDFKHNSASYPIYLSNLSTTSHILNPSLVKSLDIGIYNLNTYSCLYVFKFDDFKYINENDYITKNIIYHFKMYNPIHETEK